MMKIKFETVRKYSDFETTCVDFYDYYDLLKFLQRHGYVPQFDKPDWELRELSQKKLKQLIIDNFNKKHFFDITEIEVEG